MFPVLYRIPVFGHVLTKIPAAALRMLQQDKTADRVTQLTTYRRRQPGHRCLMILWQPCGCACQIFPVFRTTLYVSWIRPYSSTSCCSKLRIRRRYGRRSGSTFRHSPSA